MLAMDLPAQSDDVRSTLGNVLHFIVQFSLAEPVRYDTGLPSSRPQFLDALWSQVDPADVRWIYLTHPDRDHTGSVFDLLDAAPSARLVTTFLGMGILSLEHEVPPDRVFLLNPGQSLDVGDRRLTAFRPPVYDSPATTGIYDQRTGTCFSSDCFGAPLARTDLIQTRTATHLNLKHRVTLFRLRKCLTITTGRN